VCCGVTQTQLSSNRARGAIGDDGWLVFVRIPCGKKEVGLTGFEPATHGVGTRIGWFVEVHSRPPVPSC
jgi:hypothetical protein